MVAFLFSFILGLVFLAACSSPPPPPQNSDQSKDARMDPLLGDLESDEDGSEEDMDLEEESSDVASDPEIGRLLLPEYIERIDIDRFLRDRRGLMLRYFPIQPKYDEIYRAFAPGLVLDRAVERTLSASIDENKAKWHWIFLTGVLTLHEDLANQSRSSLLDQRKALVAQHGRALLFLAKELDRSLQTTQYQDFFRRLYRLVSERNLYRKVEPRDVKKKEE